MTIASVMQSRVGMKFDYVRVSPGGAEELIARGEQQIACMRERNGRMAAAPVPESMLKALNLFMDN
jgi:enediyne biosynthesis thioesterase